MSRLLIYAFFLLLLATLGIVEIHQERVRLPYRFTDIYDSVRKDPGTRWFLKDINGDGFLDRIQENRKQRNIVAWVDVKGEYRTLLQYNFRDTNFTFLGLCDVDGDGWNELLVSRKLPDSIYVEVISENERVTSRIRGFGGKDTRRNDGVWDGNINIAGDFESPGGERLIIILADTGYDRYPRGVRAYSADSGEEVWRYDMGASGLAGTVEDIDGDGRKEIVVTTFAPCNGAKVNGTDDFHSYILCLESDGSLQWKIMTGGKYSNSFAYWLPPSQDVPSRLVAMVSSGGAMDENASKCLLIEPRSGEIVDSLPMTRAPTKYMVSIPDSTGATRTLLFGTTGGYVQRFDITAEAINFVEEEKIIPNGMWTALDLLSNDKGKVLFCADRYANYYLVSLDMKLMAARKSGFPAWSYRPKAYIDRQGKVRVGNFTPDGKLHVAGVQQTPAPWRQRGFLILAASIIGLGFVVTLRYSQRPGVEADYGELKRLLAITSHGELSCVRILDGFSKYLTLLIEQERIRTGQRETFSADVEESRDIFQSVIVKVWDFTRRWKIPPDVARRMRTAVRDFPAVLDEIEAAGLTKDSLRRTLPAVERSIRAFMDYMGVVEDGLRARYSVDLPRFVRGILGAMGVSLASKNVELILKDEWPESCKVWGTQNEYRMVIENLLSNAVRAMHDSVRRVLSVKLQEKTYRLVLDVEDTGCGVGEEVQADIFKEGFSTKEGSGGSGLYQSRLIMNSYGGIISLARSAAGKGSLFRLEFVKIRERKQAA